MQGYFPYSPIITGSHANAKQSIGRYAYTSAWQVFDKKSESISRTPQATISEIYY